MNVAAAEASLLETERSADLGPGSFARLARRPGVIAGVVLLLAFLFLALLAPVVAPFDPGEAIGGTTVAPSEPSGNHLFGVDEGGRDVFSRVVFGARLALLVGFASAITGSALGLLVAMFTRRLGGWVDRLVMRAMDLVAAFPAFFIAVALVIVLGRGLWQIVLAISIAHVPAAARLLRAAGRDGLPGSLPRLIPYASFAFAGAMIELAGLSFVNLGPQVSGWPEWGLMVAEGISVLELSPHLVLFPGSAIVLSALAANLIAGGSRAALDPRWNDG